MDAFVENLTPKEWEQFCSRMLRYHYGANNFWDVPDADQGDLGLEFFSIDGTLYQCYFPDKNVDMVSYKNKLQAKIRNDVKKLKSNEEEIGKLLDGAIIKVKRWVLLVPEMKSKDLIKYCNTKKKQFLKNPPYYIDIDDFQIKIDTSDCYPAGALYAKQTSAKAVDIPLIDVTHAQKSIWQDVNVKLSENIQRKSDAFMGSKGPPFKDKVVEKYIQIERFLDELRENYPDVHGLIEDSARAQLDKIKNNSLFEDALDKKFVSNILMENEKAFSKHANSMSDTNIQSLSFGYLSKWLAECYMDFNNDEK